MGFVLLAYVLRDGLDEDKGVSDTFLKKCRLPSENLAKQYFFKSSDVDCIKVSRSLSFYF